VLYQWFRMPFQRVYTIIAACSLLALFFSMRVVVIRNQEAEISTGVNRAAQLLSASLSGDAWSGTVDEVGRKALEALVVADSDINAIFVVRRTDQPTTLEYIVEARVTGVDHPMGSKTDVQLLPGAAEALGIGRSLETRSSLLGLYPILDANERVVGLVGVEQNQASIISLKGNLTVGFATLLVWMLLVFFVYVMSTDDKYMLSSMLRLKSGKKIDVDTSAVQLQRRVTQLAEAASRRSFVHREAFVGEASAELTALRMEQSGFSGGESSVVLAIKIVGMHPYEVDRAEKVSLDMSYSILEVLGEVLGTHGGILLNYWSGAILVLFEHDDKGGQFRQLVSTLERLRTRLDLALRELERTAKGQEPRDLRAKYGVDVGKVLSTPRGGRHWRSPVAIGLPIRGASELVSLETPDGVEVLMTERVVRRLRLKHAVVDIGQHEVAGSTVRVLGL
jgi:hypothetical protein